MRQLTWALVGAVALSGGQAVFAQVPTRSSTSARSAGQAADEELLRKMASQQATATPGTTPPVTDPLKNSGPFTWRVVDTTKNLAAPIPNDQNRLQRDGDFTWQRTDTTKNLSTPIPKLNGNTYARSGPFTYQPVNTTKNLAAPLPPTPKVKLLERTPENRSAFQDLTDAVKKFRSSVAKSLNASLGTTASAAGSVQGLFPPFMTGQIK